MALKGHEHRPPAAGAARRQLSCRAPPGPGSGRRRQARGELGPPPRLPRRRTAAWLEGWFSGWHSAGGWGHAGLRVRRCAGGRAEAVRPSPRSQPRCVAQLRWLPHASSVSLSCLRASAVSGPARGIVGWLGGLGALTQHPAARPPLWANQDTLHHEAASTSPHGMDAALRHLRDGREPSTPPPTLAILDSLAVLGGAVIMEQARQPSRTPACALAVHRQQRPAAAREQPKHSFAPLLPQVVSSLINAMQQGRSQATLMRVVDPTGRLAHLASPLRSSSCECVQLIDLFSDPWGWATAAPSASSTVAAGCTGGEASCSARTSSNAFSGPVVSLQGLQDALTQPNPLEVSGQDATAEGGTTSLTVAAQGATHTETAASQSAAAVPGPTVCVVLGCLSSLMDRYGEWQVRVPDTALASHAASHAAYSHASSCSTQSCSVPQALALLEAARRAPVVSCVLTAVHTVGGHGRLGSS